ncbi:glycoside hydrolase family 18 protein [Streptomyces paludis]|uniref:Hydrolase n=1 Tax=Streptomyces paludis TaxID=2282738 RepID=A0A345HNX8_9ACTN|nr:hydrolase [Streptomyces paludis]AXG78402.1 hydrolase [Streptomyces paludis]
MRSFPNRTAVLRAGAVALILACAGCSTGTAADTGQGSAPKGGPSGPGGPAGDTGAGTATAPTGYAPYVSATTAASTDATGSPATYNLAFAVADSTDGSATCAPAWGGTAAYGSAAVAARTAKLTSSGADLRVSFGGAAGTELALACGSADKLAAAYAKALDAVGAAKADFDIEGDALTDTASISLRNKALAQLQSARDLDITYTLPVMPDGLEKTATAVLSDAVKQGVDISAVNIMAMNYSTSNTGDMGDYAESAAEAAHDQIADTLGLSSAKAWRALHITAMIGVNDVAGETFTLADATQLRAFARRKGVGTLSMWATFRDQRCADGVSTAKASDACSGVDQKTGAFAKALSGTGND